MNVSKIKRWEKPEGSYGYSAFQTYTSSMFTFRTGSYVSVLGLAGSHFSIELDGRVKVDSDADCWKIINKLKLVEQVVDDIKVSAEKWGENKAKRDLREWLKV